MPTADWWNDDSAALVKLGLAAVTLAVVVARELRRRQGRPAGPASVWLGRALRALGVLGALAYVNFGAFHFDGIRVHLWDMAHYALGAKYFDELGYDGLYECIAVADAESGALPDVAGRALLDLRTNRLTTAAEILAHPERCQRRFAPARWRAFTVDVGFFRDRFPAKDWERLSTDHGFNASPAWVRVAHPLVGDGPITWPRLLLLSSLDPLLVATALGAVAGAFGGEVAAVVAVVFGTYFPGRSWWTGGSLLRWDWLAALLGGLALCRRGRMFGAGVLLGYAALVRVFPAFALAGAALAMLASRLERRPVDRHRNPQTGSEPPAMRSDGPSPSSRDANRAVQRAFRSLVLGALAVTLLLGGLAAGHPHGWRAFAGNLSKHTSVPSPNRMGLATIVAWDRGTQATVRAAATDGEMRTAWENAASETLAHRRWLWLGLAAAGVVALAIAVRGQPLWAAATLGLLLAPLATPLACYYYVFVAALPLLAARRSDVAATVLVLVVASGLVARLAHLATPEQYAAQSLLVLLAFGFVASEFIDRRRSG